MPDPQPGKRQPTPMPPRAASSVAYAELHCRTNFSFLEGASHPDELVAAAAALGHTALGITDRASLAGVVRAHVAAKEAGVKLVIGAQIEPSDASPILLWASDRAAYGRLSQLITLGRREAPKGECHLTLDDVARFADGLLAGVLLRPTPQVPGLVREADLNAYREIFADRCYAIAELLGEQNDRDRLQQMRQLSRRAKVPLAAANDVHYHVRRRRPLHDVLTAIRLGCTVAELGSRRFPNAERHLKPPAAMLELFREAPEAIERTVEIAARCTFSLDELRYDYPEELCPAGQTPHEHLSRLTWEGARQRYPEGIPSKVRELIEHELKLIAELRYEAYFLTVWDLVRFARRRGILCQGRGSAANSVVCFCLGITSVDPERIDVLFERFVSKERNEAPDIDVDFEHERREEVIQYIYDKYGRDRAGMTAEVITYRLRSAVRDVGKALGLSLDRVDRLAKGLDHHSRTDRDNLATRFREAGLDPESRLSRQLLWLVHELLGFPRHLSQHVGGMVITHHPLSSLVPIENATMPGRTVIQWDKDDLDALGILKVDCLALGMLTAIHKCFDLIESCPIRWGPRPEELSLATIPAEDPKVYDMICRADTVGVFQIESRAQMSMLPRLKPRCYYDLVIEVAIVRPGPIQGKMVHPYLRRRSGQEAVDYPSPEVESVLRKTLGVPLFQEQAMKLAMVAAGFTPGQADQLRRAMGAWRRRGVMDKFRDQLIEGMLARGYRREFAERVYEQICGFGEYGFPESHAASFALLVYVSAWLKCYYPEAFCAALLNSQPMGFYAPAQLIADARRHHVVVRPIDINHSSWDCTLEVDDPSRDPPTPPALRLGLRLVRGLSRADVDRIVSARAAGPFLSFADLVRRTGLRAGTLKRLAQADAFGSFALPRRLALWRALPERGPLTIWDQSASEQPLPQLPLMSLFAEVLADYRSTSLTLRPHPISFLRPLLRKWGVVPAQCLIALKNDVPLKVGGIVLLRQRPGTANGVTFMTLEDETGTVNLIVHRRIWERYRRAARGAIALIAHGRLQTDGQVIHVLVTKLQDLSDRLRHLDQRSRDFH
jgi:error-prone DNA polymerase